jgi:ATP-binding cassette subfamily C (CFTR/MRP) protein 4
MAGETRLVKAEDNVKGSVAWGTYLAFARIAGFELTVAVLWLFILSQGALLTSNYWLGLWAEAKDQTQAHYAAIFSAITGATVLLAVARSILFYFATLRASSSLHNVALRHVLGTRLGFFSANPHGRVLNRFSGDIGNVDELLSQALHEVFDLGCVGVGALTLICISVPPAIPFLFAMLWYMLHLRRFVVKSMTELKRLDSVSRSPVFDCYAATMRGLVCLRAFRREEAAQERMLDLLDANAKAWFWWLITNRFLGFRLDMQAVLVMAFAAVGGAAIRDFVGPEFIGLAIVHAISLSGLFQFMVRQSALAESYMTSFQRLQTYAALPNEPDDGSHKPTTPFPTKGTIVVSGLCMRYRDDLPLVLKGVDFACPGGIKVGICGRTGSGKSSIFMAMARLAEITAGHITVDGVDVASMPLRTLRMCIAWVPQEPSFFTGTLRSNLDPFQQHGDGEVWEALRAVEMADALGCEGLQLQMAEQGSNFSAGERQLLSLSRSLLQRRRVLCMDEAFANVDFATDAKVQRAIRVATHGLGVTVLVIAHRLQTLADAGYVVVMNAGTVEEHGPPAELLQENGAYAEMVRQSGLDVRAAHALASAGGHGAAAPATTLAAPMELCAAPCGDAQPKQLLESGCVSPALLACAPQLRWAAQSGKGDGASGPACIPSRE